MHKISQLKTFTAHLLHEIEWIGIHGLMGSKKKDYLGGNDERYKVKA